MAKTKIKTTVTRADIVQKLAQKEKLSHQKSKDFLEATLEFIIAAFIEGKGVKLSSFGSFRVLQKTRRIARNPKTGKEAVVTPRRVLTFRPSPCFKSKVEKPEEDES